MIDRLAGGVSECRVGGDCPPVEGDNGHLLWQSTTWRVPTDAIDPLAQLNQLPKTGYSMEQSDITMRSRVVRQLVKPLWKVEIQSIGVFCRRGHTSYSKGKKDFCRLASTVLVRGGVQVTHVLQCIRDTYVPYNEQRSYLHVRVLRAPCSGSRPWNHEPRPRNQ